MGLKRNVGFFQGLKYQGGGPMLAWMLHRITGLSILLIVGLHVYASFFMQQTGSDLGTTFNIIYESWIFQIIVIFIVIFHGLNGLRIIILDVWPNALRFQREALWLQWFIFVPVYGLTIFILVYTGLIGG
jgi:succinate dehydrogenase / fumarate reductase cytochrome b subunit